MDTLALVLHTRASKINNFEFDLEDFSDYVDISRENDFKIPEKIEDVITEMHEIFHGRYGYLNS